MTHMSMSTKTVSLCDVWQLLSSSMFVVNESAGKKTCRYSGHHFLQSPNTYIWLWDEASPDLHYCIELIPLKCICLSIGDIRFRIMDWNSGAIYLHKLSLFIIVPVDGNYWCWATIKHGDMWGFKHQFLPLKGVRTFFGFHMYAIFQNVRRVLTKFCSTSGVVHSDTHHGGRVILRGYGWCRRRQQTMFDVILHAVDEFQLIRVYLRRPL